MRNKILLVLVLIVFLPLASADILMEVPQQESNIEGLQKSYEIGFVNTGTEEINLTLNSSVQTDMQLDYPQRIVLPPSEITSNPEGEGWYYLGGGDYAEIRYVDLDAAIPLDTDTRRHEFDIAISRIYRAERNRPNVETIQEIGFSIFSTSERINTGFQAPEEEGEEQNSDQEAGQKEGDTSNPVEKPQSPTESTGNVSNSTSSPSSADSGPVDGVTILLILGIILAVAWMSREVLM